MKAEITFVRFVVIDSVWFSDGLDLKSTLSQMGGGGFEFHVYFYFVREE